MQLADIKADDWTRIFFGPVPSSFYAELVVRAFVIYLLVFFSMRLFGKRMTAHISQLELVALVSISSGAGIALLTPDNGLLPAFLIAFMVVAVTKAISRIAYKNNGFEKLAQGKVDILLEDAVLNYFEMSKAAISRERLFAQLRSVGINHLGSVKRVQLEINGAFTIVKANKAVPGLLILPEWDEDFIARRVKQTDVIICGTCGLEKHHKMPDDNKKCANCGNHGCTRAVVDV